MKLYSHKFTASSIIFVLVLITSLSTEAAISKRYTKKQRTNSKSDSSIDARVVKSSAGLNIKEWSIAIDAIYNPQLDRILPDHHIVNIVLTNRREEPIILHPGQDRWVIIDSLGKRHTADNHIKQFDKKLWQRLPKRLQTLLAYPHVVNPGKATTIDVFLPKSVDLTNFREVVWKSSHFDKEFNIFTDYEKTLSIKDNPKEFNIPQKTTSSEDLLKQMQEQYDSQSPSDSQKNTNQNTKVSNQNSDDNKTESGFIRFQ